MFLVRENNRSAIHRFEKDLKRRRRKETQNLVIDVKIVAGKKVVTCRTPDPVPGQPDKRKLSTSLPAINVSDADKNEVSFSKVEMSTFVYVFWVATSTTGDEI